MQLQGKKVLVCGMARSGVALARVLLEEGARVRAYDMRPKDQMQSAADALKGWDVDWQLGSDPMTLVSDVDAVFISPGVPIDSPFLERARAQGVPVIGEVELAYRLGHAPIAAVTGTNGKTTTTALLGEILAHTGKKTFVVGNIGTPFISVARDTRPEDCVVAEISSFQMESADTFHPRAAAILNITEDHLNRHGTMDVYIACKARIFECMQGDDVLVLNADDPILCKLAEQARCEVRWFSRKRPVDNGACLLDGNIVLAHGGKKRVLCSAADVYIPGPHNLENAMAASLLAEAMGAQDDVIVQGLRTFKGVEHRLEPAGEVQGVRFVNDSKGTNVDATIKAVEAMTGPTILLLGGYDKGSGFAELYRAFTPHIRAVVALGATRQRVYDDGRAAGFDAITLCDGSFEDAVRMAYHMAQPGDTVLLSPASASFDMFSDYEARGRAFKEIVRRL
nr:UDP-N-acetylmuramoyl-L-alanine--D-glutamate ligase [Maliibacterium massiliense]